MTPNELHDKLLTLKKLEVPSPESLKKIKAEIRAELQDYHSRIP